MDIKKLGNHTVNHKSLPDISDEEIKDATSSSVRKNRIRNEIYKTAKRRI